MAADDLGGGRGGEGARRTSFSTLVNESNDFACVLTDAAGQSLAQNTESIPSFIGTLPVTVKEFIKQIGLDNMAPGDVLVTNTPWIATGHLNDITVAKPIFRHGRIVAFAASTAHAPDIGGKVRSVEPREVFEEGFHIPVMKFINEGKPDQTFLKLLRAAVRTPDQTEGDLWAQITGLDLLEKRLGELMAEYGLDDLDDVRRRDPRPLRAGHARRHPRSCPTAPTRTRSRPTGSSSPSPTRSPSRSRATACSSTMPAPPPRSIAPSTAR